MPDFDDFDPFCIFRYQMPGVRLEVMPDFDDFDPLLALFSKPRGPARSGRAAN